MTTNPDLLDVVHAFLAEHRAPDWFGDHQLSDIAENYVRLVVGLRTTLEDAGSAYTVAADGRSLIERVDSTVVDAVERTIDTAPPTASTPLRDAWQRAGALTRRATP